MNIDDLQYAIEKKRKILSKTVSKYGLNSQKAIQCSHKLDKLINDYNHLKKLEKDNNK